MRPEIPHYLAFDLGASSCRAVLGRLVNGRLEMEEASRFETPISSAGGHLYWDVSGIQEEMQAALTRVVRQAPLVSVSVDSWGVDYVPLDASGRLVRPPHCYRDPRTRGAIDAVASVVPVDVIYEVTGIQFMEINTLYQVWCDLRDAPEAVSRTATRLLIADYFNHVLGGAPVAERSLASTTQAMSAARDEWAIDVLGPLGLQDAWPEIVTSGTVIGSVRGFPEIAVVAGCSHDTACAVAAAPGPEDGSLWAYISCGTWSLLGYECEKPILTREARAAGFTNEAGLDGTTRFLKNMTGLWILQECERIWRERGESVDTEALVRDAAASTPTTFVLDVADPAFAERGDMPRIIAEHCERNGWTVPDDRPALVRLVIESLADGHRRTLEVLERLLGRRVSVIHMIGGGVKNELLCSLTAERCGRPVIAGPVEATSMGNLLIQARTMGHLGRVTVRDVARRSADIRMYHPAQARA